MILTKACPYVYQCTHLETGKFYIGYREVNTKSSYIDLPNYRTSSKEVKENFDNYEWKIIAEFISGDDAYDFEQNLIAENWNNPLLLNKQYRLPTGEKRFKARKGISKTEQHKIKIGLSKKGKPGRVQTVEEKEKRSIDQLARGGYGPKQHTEETRLKMSLAHTGKLKPWNSVPKSEEFKKAQSIRQTGKIRGPNKKVLERIVCPHCNKTVASNNYPQHHGDNCKQKN
jgi:hypothetical protein